jgi:stage II sporulation protein D
VRLPLVALLVVSTLVAGSAPADQEGDLPAPRLPMGAEFRPRVPRLLRVGLATDLDRVSVPCCQGHLIVQGGSRAVGASSAIRIEPSAEIRSAAYYRIQVAALKDEQQGERLAGWLSDRLGQPADSVFDAATDLYRVRVGRYDDRVEAERDQRDLRAQGLEPWIVSEHAELGATGFRVSHAGGETAVDGRWLSITRSEGGGLRVEGSRYRGRVLLYLNDRGRLNLINELSLEDYLRGVVPMEMGPIAYSSLEALKAQTVAARTYSVRNLGEFDDEGYDICATPRCQVFGGMDAEHPLSDRAVRETAGQVLIHQGEIVDALYSSSCGGHTEDVELVFPLKHHAYLRGVPCPESGVDPLVGDLERGVPFVEGLMARILPTEQAGFSANGAAERLGQLAELAGLPVPDERLASLDRREVRRFVGSLFDLVLDARLFSSGGDAPQLLEEPPTEWSEEDLQLAAYLDRTGLLSGPFAGELSGEDFDEMLYQLAVYLEVLHSRHVRYLSREDGELRVRSEEGTESIPFAEGVGTYRGGEFRLRSAPLVLRPGDEITLYFSGEELVAVSQLMDGEAHAGSAGPKVKPWRRMHTDSHLREMVRVRYPEIDFAGFEILKRGVSGRVGSIELRGKDGATVEVEGLAVRWTLDLPDTLFSARRVEPSGRESGWLFTGRGRGHGVGMCQLGAYGMGVRGLGYDRILNHYYTDVELATLELIERPTTVSGAR